MLRVVRKKVGLPPEVVEADLPADGDKLKFMRDEIGGYVECVYLSGRLTLVCDEEGLYGGPGGGPKPQNAAGLLGDILVVAVDDETGDTVSLTDAEVDEALAYLELTKDMRHPGASVVVR